MSATPDRPPVESADYWQQRYENGHTGWDTGEPEAPLVQLFHDGVLTKGRMLVPGCGNGWEVTAFAALGFEVTGLDFAAAPLENLRQRAEAAGLSPTLLQADLFDLPAAMDGLFDVVLELACFCAIAPEQRDAYAATVHRLLKPGGQLVGLFYTPPGKVGGPPFTSTRDELEQRFAPYFPSMAWTPRAADEMLGILTKAPA